MFSRIFNSSIVKKQISARFFSGLFSCLIKWNGFFAIISSETAEFSTISITMNTFLLFFIFFLLVAIFAGRIGIKRTNEQKPQIRGWLTFFLMLTGISTFFSAFGLFTGMSLAEFDLYLENERLNHFMMLFGAWSLIILFLGATALALLMIVAFYKFKPYAVALGKSYLIILSASCFALIFAGEPVEIVVGILVLIWNGIWLWYLLHSKQVNALFPKQERKMYTWNKVFLVSIFLPFVIYLLSIFVIDIFEDFSNEIHTEKWTYEVVGDILTIDSQQVEGMKFRYVFGGGLRYARLLVGTWFWNEDYGYTLVFNADGSGRRGWYPEDIETFTWLTSGDTLRITVLF